MEENDDDGFWDWDDDEEAWEEENRISGEEMAYWKTHGLKDEEDPILAEELLPDYDHLIYPLEQLDGDYIDEYNRKVSEGGIEVNEEYRDYAEKNDRLVKGFDPRTGIYGVKIAAAGFYSAGFRYWEKGDLENAARNFGQAGKINPRLIISWANKAKCHMEMAEKLEGRARRWQYWYAVVDLWNATEPNPAHLARRSEENRAVFERFDPESKVFFRTQFTEHSYLRGVAYLRKEDYNDAADEFTFILKDDPGHLDARHARLVSNMKMDAWKEVLEDAQILIEAKHQTLYAVQCRGIAYYETKKYDEAITDFDEALRMDENLQYIYTRRSFCYNEKGNYQKAVEDASTAIRLGDKMGYSYRGLAYIGLGEYEKAVADFDVWLAENPKDRWAAKNRKNALKLLAAKGG